MKMCLQKRQHSPFIFFPRTHRQKDVEMLKRPPSPVLCPRRVRNSELLPGDQTVRSSLPVLSQMPVDSMTAQAVLLLAALLPLPRAGAAHWDLLLSRGCAQPSLVYSEPLCPTLAREGAGGGRSASSPRDLYCKPALTSAHRRFASHFSMCV